MGRGGELLSPEVLRRAAAAPRRVSAPPPPAICLSSSGTLELQPAAAEPEEFSRGEAVTQPALECRSRHAAPSPSSQSRRTQRGNVRNKRQKMLKCLLKRGCGDFKGCVTPPTSPSPSAALNSTI